MWNDTEIPLAHLITFQCYGTWLHGDARGSVDRVHNVYETPLLGMNTARMKYETSLMKSDPVKLDAVRRNSVRSAIRETCEKRCWLLHAINIRTNHVHTVAAVGTKSAKQALIAFKAKATRQMRENFCWDEERSPWAEKGSKRNLWNERHLELAIDYVINGQGLDLPKFD